MLHHCRKDFTTEPECIVLARQTRTFDANVSVLMRLIFSPGSNSIASSQKLTSSTPSLLPSQHQPDDPRSRPEQPRQKLVPTWYRAGKPSQQEKCVPRSVEPQGWTQTQDCGGGLGGLELQDCAAEGGPQGGREQQLAGTQKQRSSISIGLPERRKILAL